MAGITLAQAETKLANAMAAYDKALAAQAYNVSGRSVSRADLDKLERAVKYWNGKVNELSRASGGLRVRTGYYDG